MAVERSSCHLEIPPDVVAVLASVDAQDTCYPVWTFSKHNSGYSLKLFWKSERLKLMPTLFLLPLTGKNEANREWRPFWQRIGQWFLLPLQTRHAASETVSGAKVGSSTCTPNSYADALSVPGIGTSTSGQDADTQVPSNTCGLLASPQSAVGDESSVVLSPVARRTRSKVSSQCKSLKLISSSGYLLHLNHCRPTMFQLHPFLLIATLTCTWY